jgi:arylsulfatase A-like enzyme
VNDGSAAIFPRRRPILNRGVSAVVAVAAAVALLTSAALAAIRCATAQQAAPAPAAEKGGQAAPAAAATPRRSLLVITLDTTRRDAMGFLGHEPSVTPNLDALAAESVIFEDAWTVTPLTLPAHSSLMTGLYPLSHHLRDNSIAPLPDEAVTLAERLQAAGYRRKAAVAAFVLDPTFGLNQGFEAYDPVRRDPLAVKLFMPERQANAMVDKALADLATFPPDGAPFFYWLHLFDAHFPYDPPGLQPHPATTPIAIKQEKRRCYFEEIRFVDQQVGRLLDALRQRPDWKELLIVVAADHGESLCDGLEPTHGWFVFDPTMRVPLLVRDPAAPPHRSAQQVSLIDVMPTVLDLLGVAHDDLRFDGKSLAPLVRGQQESFDEPRTLVLESWYAYANFGWAPIDAAVRGPLKYVQTRRERLFDRAADPGEKTNLFAPDDPRAEGLKRMLAQLQSSPAASLTPKGVELSDDARRALIQLGYVQTSFLDLATRPDASTLDDVEDHLDLVFELEEINEYFAEGKPQKAIQLLRKACEAVPNSAALHEQLGALLLTLNDPGVLDEAEDHLHKALSIDSHRSRSHFDVGLIAMRRMGIAQRAKDVAAETEQRGKAIAGFRLALGVDRNSPQALANLASMLWLEAAAVRQGREPAALSPDERTRCAALLTEAIGLLDRFLTVLPADHADRPKMTAALEQYRTALEKLRSAN